MTLNFQKYSGIGWFKPITQHLQQFLLVFVTLFITLQPLGTAALSDAQLKVIQEGARYFNTEPDAACAGSGPLLSGNDNIAKIYNYFIGKGLKDYQAAGILGNMHSESGYNPRRVQGTPTPSGDSDTPPPGAIGYGLAQFTPGTKILPYATETGRQPSDLGFQLDFIWKQFQGEEKAAYDALVASTNVAEATLAFETKYERHAGPPQPDRIVESERVLALASAGSLTGSVANAASGAGGQTVVVIDPGHSGPANLAATQETDPTTGIQTIDNDGAAGERQAMWDTAQIMQTALSAAGYKVILTKNGVDDEVGLLTRAKIANDANAAIAVSLHYSAGTFGQPNDHWGATPQEVGRFRENKANNMRKTFDNATIAQKSQDYAQKIATARTATGDVTKVSPLDQSFPVDRPDIKAWGDISIVQLFSSVPWVYNETGSTGFDKQKYADGIVAGIEQAVPANGAAGNTNAGSCGGNTGGLTGTVLSYAWPEYHPAPYVTLKPEYATAVQTARLKGEYIGGINYPGVDCGGFITRVMLDSGFEPGYNYGGKISAGAGSVGGGQAPWLQSHWQLLGTISSSSQLQPGDVAIKKDMSHTFMYVGTVPGFGGKIASASLDERAPMAGSDDVTSSEFEWFRKK